MKKLKASLNVFTKISLLCFAFFVLFPSLQAQAVFSDTDNINMGIKLELGTVSLDEKNVKTIPPLDYSGEDSVEIASSTLVNDGSLTGKLAYKIDVTEGDRVLTADELKNTMISIEFKTEEIKVEATTANLNTNSFAFIKNMSGKDIVIEPNYVGEVPVTVSYKSNTPTKKEELTVKVTFKLIQSNAANANAEMFSDEILIENVISLVPKINLEENYWPDARTFIKSEKGNFTYSMEKMKVVFSETNDVSNPNQRYIKNLNKAVLYIKFPEEERVTKQIDGKQVLKISRIGTGNKAIKYESIELDEKNNGMIVTFKLDDSYFYDATNPNASTYYMNKDKYELSLSIEIEKYGMYEQKKYGYYDNSSKYEQFFATRLVLSSDAEMLNSSAPYSRLPIKLSNAKKQISFKKFYTLDPYTVEPIDFVDFQLTNEDVKLEVIEKTAGQVSYSLISKNIFSLGLEPNETFDGATLNVNITGDTKNTLVISRELELQNYLVKIKSAKISSTTKEIEQQTNSEEKIDESSSMIDSTVPNNQVIEEPIDGEGQEEVEEVVDSSSADSDAEIKEETVPIENSDQSTPGEKISDEQINE